MELFEQQAQAVADHQRPLADRMRPRRLDDLHGQESITGPGSLVRHAIEIDRIFSMILWGPPGCGKTTLARIVARETSSHFIHFSAVLSGVKQIREVIEEARKQLQFKRRRTVLFVDEIHRFNKAQQDAFLHHVESGLITLIGATTENPSFEVISALLSRCRVITLNSLDENSLGRVLDRALADKDAGLGEWNLALADDAREHLVGMAGGDARTALNNLEVAVSLTVAESPPDADGRRTVTLAHVESAIQKKALLYDKGGEEHFNLISAFHKSMRGSDPDAALYWLARMMEAGEDPLYVARRMVRFASEDVGNADPYALRTALDAVEAYRFLGSPEGELALAQAAAYLATAPKSNRVYSAYNTVCETVRKTGALPVPLHIRNAPTAMMKQMGYGKGYRYPHDEPDAYIAQQHLPDHLREKQFYTPSDRGYEQTIRARLAEWRRKKAPGKEPPS